MRMMMSLAGACLMLAAPAFAQTRVIETTTTTTSSVGPAPVVVMPPSVIDSGDSGLSSTAIGIGAAPAPVVLAPAPGPTQVWHNYYRGDDGLMHEQTTTTRSIP